MNTKRISDNIEQALNRQATKEANAAQIYLGYAIWADRQGFAGVADLLFRHSSEERDHMMKVIQYVQQRGGHARVGALDAAPQDPTDLQDCLQKLFKHEVENSDAIDGIVELAFEEKDWATWNFGQWFVKEQIEEEALIMELLDEMHIAGGANASGEALLYLDSRIGAREDEADLARDAEVEEP